MNFFSGQSKRSTPALPSSPSRCGPSSAMYALQGASPFMTGPRRREVASRHRRPRLDRPAHRLVERRSAPTPRPPARSARPPRVARSTAPPRPPCTPSRRWPPDRSACPYFLRGGRGWRHLGEVERSRDLPETRTHSRPDSSLAANVHLVPTAFSRKDWPHDRCSEQETNMNYEILGRVVEAQSGKGVPGVVVAAYDKDLVFDDYLGEVLSTVTGDFRIVYDESRFSSPFDRKPDLYLRVKTLAGQELMNTKASPHKHASPREEMQVSLSPEVIAKAGLTTVDGDPLKPISRDALATLTCLPPTLDDDLAKQIRDDLAGKASVLEMFKDWMAQLRDNVDNDALPFRKMARLFELGATPDQMPGHHYGIAPGLRTGDLKGAAAAIGNFMGYVWGTVIGEATPWIGKSMTPMTAVDRRGVVGDSVAAEVPVFRGINHFSVVPKQLLSVGLTGVLTFLWGLKQASEAERLHFGYDRNGGHFAGHRAPSVYSGTRREVFRLNYRYHGFGNQWPLHYLIDELVQIADGLYLGQVLFATDHLGETYDPAAPDAHYRYQHFGYFLLLRPQWDEEAQRLFPWLKVPDADIDTRIVGGPAQPDPRLTAKLATLTLAPAGDGNVDAAQLAAVKQDLTHYETVIDLMKAYSDSTRHDLDSESPVYDKLRALFNAGIGPARVEGIYRGALISWRVGGPLEALRVNGLDLAWEALRRFSPWTGKIFEPITNEKLAQLTDGHEPGPADSVCWCV